MSESRGGLPFEFGGQSLIVELRTERWAFGEAKGPVPDSDRGGGSELNNLLDRSLDDSYVHLRHLDAYGVTVFNFMQMSVVIPELDRLRSTTRTPAERRVIDRVLELAHRCAGERRQFLVFVGD